MIITNSKELTVRYDELRRGDVFIGKPAAGGLNQSLLIDLLERGVICIPSPLSQIISGSKVVQTLLLNRWMFPDTMVVSRRKTLMDAIGLYNRAGNGPVVTKEDRMHCGHGIRKWDSIETLYSFVSMSESSYPFILQPHIKHFTDLRVIVAGDYVEAYARDNPDNFRMNMAAGGSSRPVELDADKEGFCRAVMERGKFPYAHIDIMVASDGKYYLSEIALNGGIKGARTGRGELEQRKQEITERLVRGCVKE